MSLPWEKNPGPKPPTGAPGTGGILFIPMIAAAPTGGEWLGIVDLEYDYFFLRGTSINFHLQGFAFDQPGPNALGLGPALTLRHYIPLTETTNIFVAGGIGVIYSDHPVPESVGSQWNLAPRAAIGFTAKCLGETRVVTGLRLAGIDSMVNPPYSRMALQAFIGLTVPLYAH